MGVFCLLPAPCDRFNPRAINPSVPLADNTQPGLRLRFAHEARRIAGQHGYLDALAAAIRCAIETSAVSELRKALSDFRYALESHFALEEQLHFPALHGLQPELAGDLARLTREHTELRAELDRVTTHHPDGSAMTAALARLLGEPAIPRRPRRAIVRPCALR